MSSETQVPARRLSSDEPIPSNIFGAIHDLKAAPRDFQSQVENEEIQKQDKFSDNFVGRIAKAPYFEQITIAIIVVNAIEIGWDADYSARWHKPDNLYDGPVGFIVFEVFFCVYFTVEIAIRFLAYRRKCSATSDSWFIFDSLLVTLMIVETAVLPLVGTGGPLGQLSILRLLRLLRITRMAKLMRAFPQLLMIVRGINAAMRAVSWTALLLVLVTMMTAVMFTNQFHQGSQSDAEVEEAGNTIEYFFGSVGKSMLSLLVMGTILDDVTACSDAIRATGNMGMLICFLCYILLNSFTMMNMLVGILVEVVGTTSESEKKALIENSVRESVMTVFVQMDADGSGRITKNEFLMMKSDPKVMKALHELSIQEKQFDYYADLLFVKTAKNDSPTLSFEEMLDCILRLRPSSEISSLDFESFKQGLFATQISMKERVLRIESMLSRLNAIDAVEPAGVAAPFTPTRGNVCEASQCAQQPLPKISARMLEELAQTSTEDIIAELQCRACVTSFEENGVPLYMMDEELQNQMKAASLDLVSVPKPEPEPEFLNQPRDCD